MQTSTKPTHFVSSKVINGTQTTYEQIGVAWDNGDGKLTFKPYGTQIVSGKIYINPIKEADDLAQ